MPHEPDHEVVSNKGQDDNGERERRGADDARESPVLLRDGSFWVQARHLCAGPGLAKGRPVTSHLRTALSGGVLRGEAQRLFRSDEPVLCLPGFWQRVTYLDDPRAAGLRLARVQPGHAHDQQREGEQDHARADRLVARVGRLAEAGDVDRQAEEVGDNRKDTALTIPGR